MTPVLLVVNKHKPEAVAFAPIALAILQKQFGDVKLSMNVEDNIAWMDGLVVVLGGDGTIISTVHRLGLGKWNSLILGVNLGHLGYLSSVRVDGFEQAVKDIASGKYVPQDRQMLQASFSGRELEAINEFVCAPTNVGAMIKLDVAINGKHLATMSGDGVLVCTPTGSTGYALSAGGAIVSPSVDAMMLVPICPHYLSNRPIVLAGGDVVSVSLNESSRQPFQLCYDGFAKVELRQGDIIKIGTPKRKVKFYDGELDEYDLVRTKLGWC